MVRIIMRPLRKHLTKMSLRGARPRINLLSGFAQKYWDCFTSLEMTFKCYLCRGFIILATLAYLLLPTVTLAEQGDTSWKEKLKRWREMSPEQKEIIKERFRRWKNLPPGERERIRRNLQRFKALTPEQHQILRERFRRFKNLSPEEKQELLENYRRWRSLSPEERQELREKFRRWRDLPPERRRELKERLRKFPPPHEVVPQPRRNGPPDHLPRHP